MIELRNGHPPQMQVSRLPNWGRGREITDRGNFLVASGSHEARCLCQRLLGNALGRDSVPVIKDCRFSLTDSCPCWFQQWGVFPKTSLTFPSVPLRRSPRDAFSGPVCRALPPVKLQPERSAPPRGVAGSELVFLLLHCARSHLEVFVGVWRKIPLMLLGF